VLYNLFTCHLRKSNVIWKKICFCAGSSLKRIASLSGIFPNPVLQCDGGPEANNSATNDFIMWDKTPKVAVVAIVAVITQH